MTQDNDNLTQLMLLRGKDDPHIKERLQGGEDKQKKYTHHNYQNEVLTVMADQVLIEKVKQLRQNGYFAIMCDEYTDISNKEQLSLCVPSVDEKLYTKENLVGFYEIKNKE